MFCQLALGLITVYVKPTVIQYKYLKTSGVLNHFVNPRLRLQKVTKRPNLSRKRLEMKQSTKTSCKIKPHTSRNSDHQLQMGVWGVLNTPAEN